MSKITVGNDTKDYDENTKLYEIAKEYQSQYDEDIVLALYNNRLTELHKRAKRDGEIKFLTTSDKNGRRAYRRSVVFLMQKAVDNIFANQKVDVKVMFSLGQGYYCKLNQKEPVTQERLDQLKAEMLKLVKEDIPLQKYTIKAQEAMQIFHENGLNDKEQIMKYRSSSNTNIYELDGCKDYFYGYMVNSTGCLKYFDLQKFEDGFMLLFPDKDTKKVAEFEPSMKLFHILNTSSDWSKAMGVPTVGALNDAIVAGKSRDIILMQEAFMEGKIGALAAKIAADKNKKFVLIAGPSSSGKTTFCYRLSAQLRAQGLRPHPISLDNYYLNRDQIPLDEFGEKDFECIEGLDLKQFNEDMTALLHGKRVNIPCFNFKTGKREYKDNYMQLEDNDIFVIEGIHGLNERLSYTIPKESKFKIYISALTQLTIDEHNPLPTTDGRLIRRIVRDSRSRNTPAQETIAMWDSVRRGEEKNIFPYQEMADEMFNSALLYEMAVLKVYAQPQLYAITPDCEEYTEAKRLLKLLDYVLPMPSEDICNNSIVREFIGGSCLPV